MTMDGVAQLSETNSDYKRANVWYFGQNVGLDFNMNPPTLLNDGMVASIECSSSICDTNGVLLYYTNGHSIFDSKHSIISNGDFIGNHLDESSVIFLKHPDNKNYIWLYSTASTYASNDRIAEYSLIDLGKDSVILKNESIFSNALSKLSATNHQNGKDIWIISHEFNTNSWLVFLLTKHGLIKAPIRSEIGGVKGIAPRRQGDIKASPSGNLIASAVYGASKVELFNFNKQNGTLFNNISIPVLRPYGVEFSRDENRLYLSTVNQDLYIYNLEQYNQQYIIGSQQKLDSNIGHGLIQLSPCHKPLIAVLDSTYLSSVNEKDSLVQKFIRLNNLKSSVGLPKFNQSYFYSPSIDFVYEMNCFENSITFEGKDTFRATDTKWYLQNKNSLEIDTILEENHTYYFKDTGEYLVTFVASTIDRTDSITKTIRIYPKVDKDFLGRDTFYCKGDVFNYKLKAPNGMHCWNWGIDGTEGIIEFSLDSTFIIDSAGVFTSTIVSKNFCVLKDTLTVKEIIPEVPIVKHNWDSLYSVKEFTRYTWYKDGSVLKSEIKDRIRIKSTGNYELVGTDIYGCRARSKVTTINDLSVTKLTGEMPKFYPNPTNAELTIEYNGEYFIELYDAVGTLVVKTTAADTSIIYLGNVSEGLYILKIYNVKNKNKVIIKKVIKQ